MERKYWKNIYIPWIGTIQNNKYWPSRASLLQGSYGNKLLRLGTYIVSLFRSNCRELFQKRLVLKILNSKRKLLKIWAKGKTLVKDKILHMAFLRFWLLFGGASFSGYFGFYLEWSLLKEPMLNFWNLINFINFS